jgi:DNA repair exonuclease SbcCD ATPase subunit
MSSRLSTTRALALIALTTVALAGCDSIYYKTMKKFGWEKRDILVKKVLEARGAQADAQKEFKTTLERFREIVAFDGGSLEDKYNKLNDALQRAEDRAKKVDDRIKAVRDVSDDLFKEWQNELGKYSDRRMRQESEQQLRATKARTETLIRSMAQAQKRVEPVLKPLRDRVLFLKHNLNARAMGALSKELDGVNAEVDALVEDLQKSVAEADAFLAEMDQAKKADAAER